MTNRHSRPVHRELKIEMDGKVQSAQEWAEEFGVEVRRPIEPMAVSVTPDRYTDPKKVAKWFRRNCKSVLGRECATLEKGDFLTFMISQ